MAGQQFCRRCGTRAVEDDASTRILAGAPPMSAPGTTTALPPRGTGEPALTARPTEQQTPFGGDAHTLPLAASAPQAQIQKRRRWPTPLLFSLSLVLGLGGMLAIALFSHGLFGKKIITVGDRTLALSAAAPSRPSDEVVLDDDGAVISERETVLMKAYEVNPDTTFSFKSPDGNLTVEGWDEERVEVRVTKRGGTAEERRNARVTLKQSDGLFSLAAANSPVKVFFEVKLPRRARKVELSSGTADVEISKLEAPLTVSVRDGSINLEDVRGPVEAKSVNGSIDVVYRSAKREGAHKFASVNGSVKVRLIEGMNADVKASVVNGGIDVDGRLGLLAQKRQVGWAVDAPLGGGGELLSIKTVNGSIKINN